MANPVLIAYASKYGSAGEVAREIGTVLTQAGFSTEVLPAQQVRDLGKYQAVVLGTSIRMEKPLKPAIEFAMRFRAELSARPLALFSLGAAMRNDTPENRDKTRVFLAPLLALVPRPVGIGFFGGKVDYRRIGPLWRFIASHDQTGLMEEGDWRDWDAIHRWAEEIAPLLASGRA